MDKTVLLAMKIGAFLLIFILMGATKGTNIHGFISFVGIAALIYIIQYKPKKQSDSETQELDKK